MKSFKFALIAACAAAISLNAEVLTKTTDISLDGKKVGKIEVLTPVEVVSKDGAKAKIKVKGAVSANYLAQIQRSVKNAEIFTVFDAESEANFKKIKEVEDDYGELWYEVEGTYEVAADALGNDANALYKQAQQKVRGDLLRVPPIARAKQLYGGSVAGKFAVDDRYELRRAGGDGAKFDSKIPPA